MTDPFAAEPSTGDQPGHADQRAFDPRWWERHYQEREPGRGVPSPHLVGELSDLPAGTALDAGCGTGADAVWLAQQGWQVTAVDISPTVVSRAERLAADHPADVAARITWAVADLTVWEPPVQYDLVISQYVHPGVPFAEFVERLARSVAPGGTLFVAGHDHADTHSAAHAPAQASIGTDAVTSVLSPHRWDIQVAETRMRRVERGATEVTMHDLVVKAHRKTPR